VASFLHEPLALLRDVKKNYTKTISFLTSVKQPNVKRESNVMEIAAALTHFAHSYHFKERSHTPQEEGIFVLGLEVQMVNGICVFVN
jgi:hypothetical protein